MRRTVKSLKAIKLLSTTPEKDWLQFKDSNWMFSPAMAAYCGKEIEVGERVVGHNVYTGISVGDFGQRNG